MSGSPSRHLVRAGIAGLAIGALSLVGITPVWAAEPVSIASVQGTGSEAVGLGTTVTVEGVITAYYAAPSNYRGYYLQTADSGGTGEDATPGASDGIFVFFGNNDPGRAIGDLVRVTGTVAEFQGQSQISATTHELVQEDHLLPEPVPLPDTVVGSDREQYEGMLVVPTGTYSLTSTHQAFNFGTLWLSAGGMQTQPTEVADAGSDEALAIAADNAARRLLLDDGYSIQVTNAAHPGEQPYLTRDTVVRLGDTFVPPEAPYVLGYGFNDWRLQPQVPITDASDVAYLPTWESANPRPETAPEVGGDATFAAFNVFNYFTTLRSDDPDARGASTAEQLATQTSKIVSAINGLDADVVALQEIENNVEYGAPVDTAIAALVDALNADAGAGTWDFVPTPEALATPGANDVITTGIIFQPDTVTPVGDSFADVDPVWSDARVPIGQTFEVGSRLVSVISNHFKSKSPPEGAGSAPADGQGFFNAERVAQAERLVAFTETIAADPEKGPDVLLLGDFNSYSAEDPIQAFEAAGFVDLGTQLAPSQETYTFDGQLGSLDHALASSSLADAVTGYGVWGINAAEWGDRGYAFGATEGGTPFRSSDHDPVLVGVSGDAQPVTIDLLTINDFHGRLESAPPVAGAALLGGMVNWYRDRNPNTIFAAAGDLIGASTFTSFIQDDQPTIDALNAIGLDVSAFGNHEFDQGRADVDDRVLPEADWPYLAANIYDRETGEPAYDEYHVIEKGGVSIGFVGAMTEELESLVSPDGISSLEVRPIVPEINRVAAALSDGDPSNGEADVIVLLVHEGAAAASLESVTDPATAFGEIVTGASADIDAIVSGHTHLQYDVDAPIPGTDRTRPVIMSGEYGVAYGHTTIVVDPETGELLSIGSEVLPIIRETDPFTPDADVAAIVAEAVAVAEELGSVSLGSISTDITRGVQSNGTTENRGSESTIGNLIADAHLAATQDLGAELALMNPGGIRADLTFASSGANDPAGNVTYKEAALVQPFANTLVTLDLTGAQLRQVLEEQWQPAGSSRPFLKLGVSGGFEYVYDPAAAAGSRIGTMWLNGEVVTDSQTIKVVANSFLAAGGDNFVTLGEGSGRADSGRIDLTAFVDYIGDNSPVEPDLAQRSVGVQLSAPASAGGYAPGEQVTATMSSLLFSKAGPTSGDATVQLGDDVLGTAPVTASITDAFDEQGAATVTFTIPSGLSGEQTLTVTGPGGTSIGVPITVEEKVVTEPVRTSVIAWPDRLLVKKGSSVDVNVFVRAADGSAPVGTVSLVDGRKPVGSVELTAADNGRIDIPTGALGRGIHLLTVRFTGDDGFESSRTLTLVIAY